MGSHRSKVLSSNDIDGLAAYISSGKCKNIAFMLGAGVSTSAGIPDFRSPETGLYANLARLQLPYPEAVFDLNFFRRNPKPFYTLAHELYPGKYRPTLTHSFVRLVAAHNLLQTCFTQNIDTLERQAGIPADKIIEAHGSFADQRCINCTEWYDHEDMKQKIRDQEIPMCKRCKTGIVKPTIVFFGEALPPAFLRGYNQISKADLVFIIGTSLTVYPFAGLAHETKSGCPRVLINMEKVSDLGSNPDDVVLLGKCDEIVVELCKKLGWDEELQKLWKETEMATEEEGEETAEETVDDLAEKLKATLALQGDKTEAGEDTDEEVSPTPESTVPHKHDPPPEEAVAKAPGESVNAGELKNVEVSKLVASEKTESEKQEKL